MIYGPGQQPPKNTPPGHGHGPVCTLNAVYVGGSM